MGRQTAEGTMTMRALEPPASSRKRSQTSLVMPPPPTSMTAPGRRTSRGFGRPMTLSWAKAGTADAKTRSSIRAERTRVRMEGKPRGLSTRDRFVDGPVVYSIRFSARLAVYRSAWSEGKLGSLPHVSVCPFPADYQTVVGFDDFADVCEAALLEDAHRGDSRLESVGPNDPYAVVGGGELRELGGR